MILTIRALHTKNVTPVLNLQVQHLHRGPGPAKTTLDERCHMFASSTHRQLISLRRLGSQSHSSGRHQLPSCYKSFPTKHWRLVLLLCQEVFFLTICNPFKGTQQEAVAKGKPLHKATGRTTSPLAHSQQRKSSFLWTQNIWGSSERCRASVRAQLYSRQCTQNLVRKRKLYCIFKLALKKIHLKPKQTPDPKRERQ